MRARAATAMAIVGRGLTAAALSAAAGMALAAPAEARFGLTLHGQLEAQPYVPDIGLATFKGDDQLVLTARAQIVARPPAGWGGCVPQPSRLCMPPEVTVRWLIDHSHGGDPDDFGADTRVIATPSQGQTTWTSERWDRPNRRWAPAAVPTGFTDADGAQWTLPMVELGLVPTPYDPYLRAPKPTVGFMVVARFRGLDERGVPVEAIDYVGMGRVAVPGWPRSSQTSAPRAPLGDGPAERQAWCAAQTARVKRLGRAIRRALKVARGGGPEARRRTARKRARTLRTKRTNTLAATRRMCPTASQPPSR